MTQLLAPPAGGVLVLQGISGYDQVTSGMQVAVTGDGFEDIRGHSHIRVGIVNNTIANSGQLFRVDAGEIMGSFWDAPIALNFRFQEFLLDAEGHVAVCIGQMPSVAPPHTNRRLDVTTRHLMYIAERDAAGTITHFLVTCDGIARTEFTTPSPSINDKISLLWRTNPRAFEFYINGGLVRRFGTTQTLPALGDTGRFLAGYAVWKTPISAVRNHLRMLAFGVMIGQASI